MKLWEKLFIVFQFTFLGVFFFINLWWLGLLLLIPINIAVKAWNMYRMTPMERQQHQEEGGSGIWC